MKKIETHTKVICLVIARCYSWGKSWRRHFYDEEGVCVRCGLTKEE